MDKKRSPEEIMAMKSNNNAIVLHVSDLGPSSVPKLMMECNNADYWHKFVIENVETYERDFILRTIIDFVQPSDMVPVNFVKKKRAFFLARNCLGALLKLVSSKLVVPNPLNPDAPLRVVIIANHYPAQQLKFDFEKDITNILKKRFEVRSGLLDLREFHKDKDLKDFFPLSQPKLLLYVLQFATELKPQILNLSNNYIKAINPIRILGGCKINTINLEKNEIAQMTDLEPLKDFKELEKLTLDGNPLCNGWDPYSYTTKLKEMFPSLTNIDGQVLKPEQKNFLCSAAGGDLVSQFLEHFFMTYDSENRRNIAPLYHKSAMFSVTYRIISDQTSCRNIQLMHYRCIDRNIKSFHGSGNQFLFRGRKAIMNALAKLPRTSHDPFAFRCDLIYYTEAQAVLVVNGLFREDKRYIGFSRTFVLKREDDGYCITNDQLHVYNALDHQVKTYACYPVRVEISSNPLPLFQQQYMDLQVAVRKITNLNYEYSQRFLETCHYDLKKTLERFIEMHLNDEIPPEAFIQIGDEGLIGKTSSKTLPKLAFPSNIIQKTYLKHPVVSARTVWQTLNDDRLAAGYKIANNGTSKDAEVKQVKTNVLAAASSNPTPVRKSTDNPNSTEQNHNKTTDVKQDCKAGQQRALPRASNQQTKVFNPSAQDLMNQMMNETVFYFDSDPVSQNNASDVQRKNIQRPTTSGGNQPTLVNSGGQQLQGTHQTSVQNSLEQSRVQLSSAGPSLYKKKTRRKERRKIKPQQILQQLQLQASKKKTN